jgi:peptidoglycan DL-endopeptidase LytE
LLGLLLALASHVAFAQDTESYVVRPGENLYSIATAHGTTVDALAALNNISDPSVLAAGQVLQVPMVARTSPTATPTPAALATVSPTPTRTPTLSTYAFIYVVQPGDTAASIARRFSLSVEDLVVANRLASPDRIGPGDQLKIDPGAAQRANATPSPTPSTIVTASPSPTRTATLSPTRTSTSTSSVVDVAMRYRGAPYAYAGVGPEAFDCSGFTYFVYRQAGQPISRDIFEQYAAGTHPARNELQPGDLVFFENTYMDGLSHVGLFVGGDQFIHAADEDSGVTVSSLSSDYWRAHWYGAARYR